MMTIEWKTFEELTHRIQTELSPNAKVTLNDRVLGIESGKKRQVDISVRERIGEFDVLIAMECKDHASPVDLPEMEAFVQKLRDIRANKGAFVSAAGFTSGAAGLARNRSIDTFRLIDTDTVKWRNYVAIPALLVKRHIRSASVRLINCERISLTFTSTDFLLRSILFDQQKRGDRGPLDEFLDRLFGVDDVFHKDSPDTRLWNPGI